MLENLPEDLRTKVRWILGCTAAAFGALAILYIVDVLGRPTQNPDIVQDSVALDWNKGVKRLNIEPIYPPQEDVYVGDVYATISGGPNFLGKSIKLWHVDLTGAIARTYANVPVFPTTVAGSQKDGELWQQEASDSLFVASARKSLSLVAFPSLVVKHARAATAGAATGFLSGIFGASRDSEETEELRFPRAETYGINAVEASAALASFCADEKSKPLCTDTGIRQMLSMVVGDEIWKPEIDPSGTQTGQYKFSVELALVSQVYLTRSIVRVHSVNSRQAQIAQIVSKAEELAEKPTPTPTSTQVAPADGSPKAGRENEATQPTPSSSDDQRRSLSELQNAIADLKRSGQGATLKAAASDGASIALNQVYPRPVAIGVRVVRRIPTRS